MFSRCWMTALSRLGQLLRTVVPVGVYLLLHIVSQHLDGCRAWSPLVKTRTAPSSQVAPAERSTLAAVRSSRSSPEFPKP